MSIIAAIDWPTLNATVDKEIRRREHHNPAISVFRWWARRPHSVIRALLEAAQSQGVRYVADPFSGGGTVALEAAALGLRAYAQDLYPWPVFGLQTALSQVDPKRLRVEGRRLLHHLDPLRRYYQREDGRELMGILRVRVVRCLECEFTFPLYPEGVLSKVRRSGSEAYYAVADVVMSLLRLDVLVAMNFLPPRQEKWLAPTAVWLAPLPQSAGLLR